jgi:phosphatidylglycerol:prolipoprotein diacylglycerol transferase
VFEVWNGGFVWYGGAIAGAGAGILWVWRKKHGIPIWLDMAAPVAALGYAIGRLACLFTGCCFGDVCTLASGLKFRYPTQAFAVVWETAVVLALLALERRSRLGTGAVWLRTHGRLFALWIALHAVGRLLMELMRADPRGPTPLGLSLSTWISFALVFGAAVAFRSTGRAGR